MIEGYGGGGGAAALARCEKSIKGCTCCWLLF